MLRTRRTAPAKLFGRSRSKTIRRTPLRLEMLEERVLLSVNQTLGDVFYIDMENHNLLQPSSVTSPQQLAVIPQPHI